jgi:4'-phosphopantetheinyl transferase
MNALETQLALACGQIDLWACFYLEIDDAPLLNAYRAMLSESERQQEQRFVFAKDRQRYLVTRALLRTALSRYAAIVPSQWSFLFNKYGKPALANSPDGHRINFNISHTDGLIVLALTNDAEIGIDVEKICVDRASLDIADRFFSAEEAAALRQVSDAGQADAFFGYWTLKEAYIKARGMGLSIPLDKFTFRFPCNESIAVDFQPAMNDHPAKWRFQQFYLAHDYLVAVCSERRNTADAQHDETVVIRKVVPLTHEEVLTLSVRRRSL